MCKPDMAGQAGMGETQQVRDDLAARLCRGQRDDQGSPETAETVFVRLITQRRLAACAAVPRTSSERKRGPGGNGDAVGNLADDALRRACSLTATNEGLGVRLEGLSGSPSLSDVPPHLVLTARVAHFYKERPGSLERSKCVPEPSCFHQPNT
jgi:hypothetical protein